MSVLPLPMTKLRPAWLEHTAARIFAQVGGATRPKVRAEIIAFHRSRGVSIKAAEADAERALAYIEARVALYRQARAINLDPSGKDRRATA